MSLVPYGTTTPPLTPLEFSFGGVSFGSLTPIGSASTSAASGTGTVTSLAVNALPVAIPAGFVFMLSTDPNTIPILFTVTTTAAKGATVLSVAASSTVTTTIPPGFLTRSTYQSIDVQGLGLVEIASQDDERPLDGGEFIGFDAAKGRTITLQFGINATSAAALDAARLRLSSVFQSGLAVEQPLFFQTAGGTTYCLMARCRKYVAGVSVSNVIGYGCTVTVEFHSTDWRLYLPTQQATVTGSGYNAVNAGGAEMRPLVVYTATVTGSHTLTITGGANSVVWTGTLTAGDTLTIDLDFRTVLHTSGTTVTSAANGLSLSSTVWWNLVPGTTVLDFTTSGTGTFVVQFASAYAGV